MSDEFYGDETFFAFHETPNFYLLVMSAKFKYHEIPREISIEIGLSVACSRAACSQQWWPFLPSLWHLR